MDAAALSCLLCALRAKLNKGCLALTAHSKALPRLMSVLKFAPVMGFAPKAAAENCAPATRVSWFGLAIAAVAMICGRHRLLA